MEVTKTFTIPANSTQQLHTTACPIGSVVLNGGCEANNGQVANIILEQTIPSQFGWGCSWRNPSVFDIQATVIISCLMPAQ